jgi:outer membrane protein TolC
MRLICLLNQCQHFPGFVYLIGIARANVRRQHDALDIANAKFQGGGTSKLDVYQATNVLEQTRASIPQLTMQLQQAENALCVLLGIPPQSLGMALSRSAGRIPSPPRTIVVGIPADLLRRRPDVRAAELATLAQRAQIGVAAPGLPGPEDIGPTIRPPEW